MNILPGIGIGNITYGINETELIKQLGKPNHIDESEYIAGTDSWSRELWYSLKNLTFIFNKKDNYRLGTITIMGDDHTLFNQPVLGQRLERISRLIALETGKIAKYEDYSSTENPEYECLIHNSLGIIFWFSHKQLTHLQCSYLFEADNNTIIWPTPSGR